MQRKSVLPVAVGRADDYDGAKDRRGSKLNTIFKIGIPLAVVATVGVVFWLQQSSTDVKVAPTQTSADVQPETVTENAAAPADADLINYRSKPRPASPSPDINPLIVMPSSGKSWISGDWLGFGSDNPLIVDGITWPRSRCPSRCIFSQNEALLQLASAVVVEPTRLAKEGRGSVQLPQKREDGLPLIGNLFYDVAQQYPATISDPSIRDQTDFAIGPDKRFADVFVSKACSWGQPRENFLKPPPAKRQDALVAFFNEEPIIPGYSTYVQELLLLLQDKIHAYGTIKNREMPPDVGGSSLNATKRMELMGQYKFVLIIESTTQPDWVSEQFTQALLAGAVPVYVGAPNIVDFAPSPQAFVNARLPLYKLAKKLANYLLSFDTNYNRYIGQFFAWKKYPLAAPFLAQLDTCVYDSQCRVCNHVRHMIHKRKEHALAGGDDTASNSPVL